MVILFDILEINFLHGSSTILSEYKRKKGRMKNKEEGERKKGKKEEEEERGMKERRKEERKERERKEGWREGREILMGEWVMYICNPCILNVDTSSRSAPVTSEVPGNFGLHQTMTQKYNATH